MRLTKFPIELEFRNVNFEEGGKPENLKKNRRTNNKFNPHIT